MSGEVLIKKAVRDVIREKRKGKFRGEGWIRKHLKGELNRMNRRTVRFGDEEVI